MPHETGAQVIRIDPPSWGDELPPSSVLPASGTTESVAAGNTVSTLHTSGSSTASNTSQDADGTNAEAAQSNRGFTRAREKPGRARNAAGRAWRTYQSETVGAQVDPVTGDTMAPALRYDNPNPNGEPVVKWDGVETLPDGTTEMIDAKTRMSKYP